MHAFILLAGMVAQSGGNARGDAAFAVLQAKCLACHDRKLHSGKLVMETREDLLKGGAHGAAVVPGYSGESLLIKRVNGEIQPRMPLEGELGPDEVDALRRWMDGGAPAWEAARADAPLDVPALKPAKPVSPQVSAPAYSPDGRMLAAAGYREVRPVAFRPDGARLASGGADRTVKLWDVETGRRLSTLSDSTDVVTTLAFDPSGRKLSAAGADRCIRTWQLEPDAGTLVQTIIAHEAEVTRLA